MSASSCVNCKTLLWINFSATTAPLFWFCGGARGSPVLLIGYAFLRARQALACPLSHPHERLLSGIDAITACSTGFRFVWWVWSTLISWRKALGVDSPQLGDKSYLAVPEC